MFAVSANKGFQVTFANGWRVSTMFDAGNYCENRNDHVNYKDLVPVWSFSSSRDAEIAVFRPDGEFSTEFPHCPEGDQVLGYITPEVMLEIMNWAQAQ